MEMTQVRIDAADTKAEKKEYNGLYGRAYVLLSGGMDSTTCLYQAIRDREGDVSQVIAVSINYGQRHKKEISYAINTCKTLGVQHEVIKLNDVLESGILCDSTAKIPECSYEEIDGISPTYVPFRNGTLLSLLAAKAQTYVNAMAEFSNLEDNSPLLKDLTSVYFGAHAEDAADHAYPDCTPEFIGVMASAIYLGTYQTVRLVTPFMWSTKAHIVSRGTELGVDYAKTWSCYKGEDIHCGKCPTCLSRKQSFRDAGQIDPTEYADASIK